MLDPQFRENLNFRENHRRIFVITLERQQYCVDDTFASYLAEGVPQRKAVKKLSNMISAYLLSLLFSEVLRIQDVYPGSEFFHSGSRVKKIPEYRTRIRINEFKYFNPKNCF